ncbi:hypothetical protein Dimus_005929 [Dionaea muscipula]
MGSTHASSKCPKNGAGLGTSVGRDSNPVKTLDDDHVHLPTVDKDAALPHPESSTFIIPAMDDEEVADPLLEIEPDPLLEIEPDLSPHSSTVPLAAEPSTQCENQTDMHPSSIALLDGQHGVDVRVSDPGMDNEGFQQVLSKRHRKNLSNQKNPENLKDKARASPSSYSPYSFIAQSQNR